MVWPANLEIVAVLPTGIGPDRNHIRYFFTSDTLIEGESKIPKLFRFGP